MHSLTTVGLVKAEEGGPPSSIAVADAGGKLLTHARMDGAQRGGIERSIGKAHTSVFFQPPTEGLSVDPQPGEQFWGMALSVGGRVLVFVGGVPLLSDGRGGRGERRLARAGLGCLRSRGGGAVRPHARHIAGVPVGSSLADTSRQSVPCDVGVMNKGSYAPW